jgi:hypothetical protein
MTPITREWVNEALFALVSALSGFNTLNRRLRHWSDVTAEQCPAFFLSMGNQRAKQGASGEPTQWTWEYVGDLQVHSEDPNLAPSTLLNQYLDQIEAALKPPASPAMPPGYPATVQVLGDLTGRIRHAWITEVETDEGVLGPRAVATFRIEVLVIQ